MTAQRLVRRLQPSLGEEFAEADEAQQQEFWSKLQAGDPGRSARSDCPATPRSGAPGGHGQGKTIAAIDHGPRAS